VGAVVTREREGFGGVVVVVVTVPEREGFGGVVVVVIATGGE